MNALTRIPLGMLKSLLSSVSPPGENFISNSQWQLWGQTTYIAKMNAAGTANLAPLFNTGFTPTTQGPVFTTANTVELKNGDIGVFTAGYQWGYTGIGYVPISGQYLTASRVSSVVTNTSFVATGNLSGVSPTVSSTSAFQQICPGDNGVGALSASGWGKTNGLVVWADDNAVNLCPGAIRVKGCRKTSSSQQTTSQFVQAKKLRRYAGRDVVFGALIYQKSGAGSGVGTNTSRLYINESAGIQYSASGTGTSYVNPDTHYGKFELLTVTKRISDNPTFIEFGLSLDSTAGSDVYYFAIPTGKYGTQLRIQDLEQRCDEIIESIHWNPPLLTPFNISFPATEIVSGSGLYGWNNVDLEAISMGTWHASLAAASAKFEWLSSTAGAYIFAADHTSNQHLRFGLQCITQVANKNDTDSGEWPTYDDGTISLFGTVPSLAGHNLTLDFWDARS